MLTCQSADFALPPAVARHFDLANTPYTPDFCARVQARRQAFPDRKLFLDRILEAGDVQVEIGERTDLAGLPSELYKRSETDLQNRCTPRRLRLHYGDCSMLSLRPRYLGPRRTCCSTICSRITTLHCRYIATHRARHQRETTRAPRLGRGRRTLRRSGVCPSFGSSSPRLTGVWTTRNGM